MADDDSRQQLTDAHGAAQTVVAAWVAAQMADVWPALDADRLDTTAALWVRLAEQVIRAGRELAAMLAGTWHRADRAVALGQDDADDDADTAVGLFGSAVRELAARTGRQLPAPAARYARRASRDGPSPIGLHPAPPIDSAALRASLVVTGPITIKRTQDPRRAARKATATAQRHALNGGREVVADAITSDRRALGWIRIPNADACAFCLMLAGRGKFYKSERAATIRARRSRTGKRADDRADHEYHDKCRCQPRAVYSRDEDLPEINRRAATLWEDTTKGLRGKYARNAFRRAVEGSSS